MNLPDIPLPVLVARAGERIWRTVDRRFALLLLFSLPVICAVRVSQVESAWSDLVLQALMLLWASCGYEYWSLRRRLRRSITGEFLPVICVVGTIVSILSVHHTTVLWTPVVMFFCFVRLSLRKALALSVLLAVSSLLILRFHWEVDDYLLKRTFFALVLSVVVLRLFFGAVADTLRELERTADLLESSMQAMAQGIVIAGADGRMVVCNGQAREMLGLPTQMSVGRALADLREFERGAGESGTGDLNDSARNETGRDGGRAGAVTKDAAAEEAASSEAADASRTLRTPEGRYLMIQSIGTPSGNTIRTYTDVTPLELVNRQLNAVLQDYGEMRRRELGRTREQLIEALSQLSRHRDDETGQHILRTQLYLRTLADSLARAGNHAGALEGDVIDRMVKAAPMHDLGKIGIPDQILKKPGRHSPDESAIMRTHAAIGEATLMTAAAGSQEGRSLLMLAASIAGGHHENWDGSGYPKGLAGEQIPLEARLMALADVYDALTTPRVYKRAWTHEEAAAEIRLQRGVKFDPAIVDAFEREQAAFQSIAQTLRDPEPEPAAA